MKCGVFEVELTKPDGIKPIYVNTEIMTDGTQAQKKNNSDKTKIEFKKSLDISYIKTYLLGLYLF